MMNTVTAITLALFTIAYVVILVFVIIKRRQIPVGNTSERRITFWIIIGYLFLGFMFVLTGLNAYEWARLPVLNEIKNKLPETYVPADVAAPPTNGTVQPQTKPTFDQHKKDMEELKNNGKF